MVWGCRVTRREISEAVRTVMELSVEIGRREEEVVERDRA